MAEGADEGIVSCLGQVIADLVHGVQCKGEPCLTLQCLGYVPQLYDGYRGIPKADKAADVYASTPDADVLLAMNLKDDPDYENPESWMQLPCYSTPGETADDHVAKAVEAVDSLSAEVTLEAPNTGNDSKDTSLPELWISLGVDALLEALPLRGEGEPGDYAIFFEGMGDSERSRDPITVPYRAIRDLKNRNTKLDETVVDLLIVSSVL